MIEKALAQCSQPLFPYKSNDLIYGVESCGSSQYLLKQDEIIYDGSTNTSVDSYAYVVLFQLLVTFQIMLNLVGSLLLNQMTQ